MPPSTLPPALDHAFRLVAFDWDGTAVASRADDATVLRAHIERLLRVGVFVVVITGTSFVNVDRQLSAAMRGPHKRRLFVAANRGSEIYGFAARTQPALLERREATQAENRLLDEIAADVRGVLVEKTKLPIEVISHRLNRRKIDLIPTPEWQDPPKSALPELLRAVEARLVDAGLAGGLREAFTIAQRSALAHGLVEARITSDVKHIEVGLTDKGDAMAWVLGTLAAQSGVAPADILVGGDEFGPIAGLPGSDSKLLAAGPSGAVYVSVGPEPSGVPPAVLHLGGGPPRFGELLAAQGALHPVEPLLRPGSDRRFQRIDEGYVAAREHEVEALFALGNGFVGSRASLLFGGPSSAPATFVAGVFDAAAGAPPQLAVLPDWWRIDLVVEGRRLAFDETLTALRRVLELDRGVLHLESTHKDGAGRVLRIVDTRIISRADPHLLLQSVTILPENFSGDIIVEGSLAQCATLATSRGRAVALATAGDVECDDAVTRVESARALLAAKVGHAVRLDRLAYAATADAAGGPAHAAGAAAAGLEEALAQLGAEGVISLHLESWERRFSAGFIAIDGDEAAESALAFATSRLLAAADPSNDRASIGARGLTGAAYQGHVFWDTEIFMLPFFTFTWPEAARALLAYRHHTLDAARKRAASLGCRGALFAWESADTGDDVTPQYVLAPDGTLTRLSLGTEEQHINADVAYAVWRYWQVTGDDAFLVTRGAEILIETARFWASRVSSGADGAHHIEHVIGPDEYHEGVDDDAYTNVMAQWNLERAAEACALLAARWPDDWRALALRLDVAPDEPARWRDVAARIYTGFDPSTGLFEQFRGYFAKEDIDLARFEGRTTPMDVVLGRARIQGSRIIKQADVVMLLALLWERFTPEVRAANFRFYEPRTDHGSSLSPPIHALVAARMGDVALAERYFKRTADIDLGNAMGNAAGGVHMAALGGLWQAAVFGFAGLSVASAEVHTAPNLPSHWRALRFSVQVHGQKHDVRTPRPETPDEARAGETREVP